MKSVISIFMAIISFFYGHFTQLDLRIEPDKYNLISLDTSVLPNPITEPKEDTFIQLSDVKMHYRVYGDGEKSLILIHGNGGSVNSLREAAEYLANDYTVYVTESRCHGQSSDPGVISYELMAKDIYEFGQRLGLEKPIIMGHSDGGMVSIAVASNYPDFPGAIISCGSNSNPSTFWPYFRIGVRSDNLKEKDKLNDMMLEQPDFNEEYLARITCPAYIVCGEFDIMKLSDTVYIHENIKGSDMAVIKGADHSSYMSHDGKKAYVLATNWLNSLGK